MRTPLTERRKTFGRAVPANTAVQLYLPVSRGGTNTCASRSGVRINVVGERVVGYVRPHIRSPGLRIAMRGRGGGDAPGGGGGATGRGGAAA